MLMVVLIGKKIKKSMSNFKRAHITRYLQKKNSITKIQLPV